MIDATPRYDRWKAPAEDGQTLIWPAPARLLQDTAENHRQLSSAESPRVQNLPLAEVRRGLRKWLGHAEDERPLIATGHQTELHHPGVWVKNALIDAAAATLDGRAIHFAVDTDEPRGLSLRWPGGAAPLAEAGHQAAWSGLLASPAPAHLAEVRKQFDAAATHWNFAPLVPAFLDSLRRLAMESVNLPSALTHSLHELDGQLGLRHESMLVSPLCLSEPYLVFVHHVLARADAFAADYNAALEQFRRENKIRAAGRPMPNLQADDRRIEVPFWLDDVPRGTRTRASVLRSDGAFVLQLIGGERFTFRAAADGWESAGELMLWLRRHGARLAPRALTLTAVLRLLVADQFVHGIGGGQYDQVLDRLIERHFGIEPPRFAVTTATLFFPEAAGRPRICLPCLAMEGHRLRHSILGEEKGRLVAAIAASPRRSLERATLFSRMHEKLETAASHPALRQWEQRFSEAVQRAQEERSLFDRELFYAIQPAQRLQGMIERYRESMRGQ